MTFEGLKWHTLNERRHFKTITTLLASALRVLQPETRLTVYQVLQVGLHGGERQSVKLVWKLILLKNFIKECRRKF